MSVTEDPIEAYHKGLEYLDYNEPDQAIAAFDAAIALRPEFAGAWFARGFAKATLGEFESAIADYDRVLQLDAEHAAAYVNRAAAYRALGDQARAAADERQYARLKGKSG